jgi:hypothetical protein
MTLPPRPAGVFMPYPAPFGMTGNAFAFAAASDTASATPIAILPMLIGPFAHWVAVERRIVWLSSDIDMFLVSNAREDPKIPRA